MAVAAAFCLLLAVAQARAPSDSLARTWVVGQLGRRLEAQLTRFAEYGFSGSVLVVREGRRRIPIDRHAATGRIYKCDVLSPRD
jgi:hypothetical protein